MRWSAKSELAEYIKKDLNRTFGDIGFFRDHEVQRLLGRVLLVWSLAHPSMSYKQVCHCIRRPTTLLR